MAIATELRIAARSLARDRGFTGVAVACLSLAIGALATIGSLIDGYWTRPLPVADPSGLLYLTTLSRQGRPAEFSVPEFLDYRAAARQVSAAAATERRSPILTGHGYAEATMSNVVSENYFTLLGLTPALGRLFDDTDASAPRRIVVMSHRLWQRRFGADPAIIGRTVRLNGLYEVIGIAPAAFRGTELWQDSDFWIPRSSWDPSGSESTAREARSQTVLARLAPGATLASAQAELHGLAARWAAAHPATNAGRGARLQSARDHLLSESGYAPVLLFATVTLVQLVACGNLANLLLARGRARRREMAVRVALGAGRARLAGQMLLESGLLAALGAVGGLLLAGWLIALLPAAILPADAFTRHEFHLDARIITLALGAAAATVLVFGLAPALAASRVDPIGSLRGPERQRRGRLPSARATIVAVQVALSALLLIASGLLLRTLLHGLTADPGFRREQVLIGELAGPDGAARAHVFYAQLLDRMRQAPGTEAATLALRAPLGGSGGGLAASLLREGEAPARIEYTAIESNYFTTLAIPLRQGRAFTPADTAAAPRVAVINEAFRRRYWPHASPIGELLRLANEPEPRRIVGVVADTRINSIAESPRPYFYVPYPQTRFDSLQLIARTSAGPAAWQTQLRQAAAAINAAVPVLAVATLDGIVRASLAEQQMAATLIGGLGLLGLTLAAVRLYGVVAYAVARRRREIGIRLALGASRPATVRMLMAEGLRPVAAGAAAGLIAALGAAGLLSHLVFGISVYDPATFAGVLAMLAMVSALATLGPALRSTRLHPLTALRPD